MADLTTRFAAAIIAAFIVVATALPVVTVPADSPVPLIAMAPALA